MKNNIIEFVVAGGLVGLAILLLNPLDFWMPDVLVMCMLAVTVALFALFAGFILRESLIDEREGAHRALAGRNAFLAGALVLTIALAVQGYSHTVDPWIVLALVAMILTKIGTRIWTDTHL